MPSQISGLRRPQASYRIILSGRSLASAVAIRRSSPFSRGAPVIAKDCRRCDRGSRARYLIGSGWKDYVRTGSLCGIALARGPEACGATARVPLHTGDQAASGKHDENISFANVERLLGARIAEQVRATSLALYEIAAAHARERGIIIADTKFGVWPG